MPIRHIVDKPKDLDFRLCSHKPTHGVAAVLPCDGTIETKYGTMAFRKGDILLSNHNTGAMYVLSPDDFAGAWEWRS